MKDTEKKLNCPACGEEMTKIWFEEKGFFVDFCADGCGGVWLDNRELDKIDEKKENADVILNAIENKVFTKTDDKKDRICPVCGATMVKYNYTNGDTPVVIDACYSCGGKFLDNNELKLIRQKYEEEKDYVNDALSTKRLKSVGFTGIVSVFHGIANEVIKRV